MKRLSLLLLVLIVIPAFAAPRSFSVRVVGQGRPMILIPGLSSPPDVWASTIEHYKDHFQLHVVSFAGFAGQPPIDAPLLATARAELALYAATLDHPVMMGHSLGGFLALAVASDRPDLVGPVVSVDGVPFLAALMNPAATPESVAPFAQSIRERYAKMSAEDFAAQNRKTLATMITRAEDVEAVSAKANLSDPRTAGGAAADMMATDLRPAMAKIRTPVLLIGAGGALPPGDVRKVVAEAYKAQIAAIPDHRFVLAQKARHFIMIDDPAFLFETVDRFLHV